LFGSLKLFDTAGEFYTAAESSLPSPSACGEFRLMLYG